MLTVTKTLLRELEEEDDFSAENWRRLLKHLGENPHRQGLIETPQRVEKARKRMPLRFRTAANPGHPYRTDSHSLLRIRLTFFAPFW